MAQRIGQRSVEFPAKSVVQCKVAFDLPAVLSEEIEAGISNVLPLRGTLRVGVHEAQEIARIIVERTRVSAGTVEGKVATDVVIQRLIEPVTLDVSTKLYCVIAFDPAQVIGELEGVPNLGQFALPAITDVETAGNMYEW